MNILYCGDRNIEKGLIISIFSLLKNVTESLNIYVLTITGKFPEKQERCANNELQMSNSSKKNRSQTGNL